MEGYGCTGWIDDAIGGYGGIFLRFSPSKPHPTLLHTTGIFLKKAKMPQTAGEFAGLAAWGYRLGLHLLRPLSVEAIRFLPKCYRYLYTAIVQVVYKVLVFPYRFPYAFVGLVFSGFFKTVPYPVDIRVERGHGKGIEPSLLCGL
jgi:hypothetical protein